MTAAGSTRDLASLVGTVLDGTYRLDQLIGEGGMGAVFRGRHVIMKRDFAIKVLHPDFNRDVELVRRFDREAQSAARLSHPNCIQVTAYGTTPDGMRYLVMELLVGGELADLLIDPVPTRQVVEWSIQILRGLEHAHEKGVIHRDLKPQNVFITKDHDGKQVLKLVDFGIAKLVGGETGDPLTRAGMVFGTPQYMSPEQALGQEIDARADLYAVGILMFQMLTGRLPFNHEDAIALIRMQVSNPPPPLPDGVPQELAAIVFRLLAKQPEQRFPDAKTVRLALERYRTTLDPRKKAGGSDPLLDVGGGGGPDLSSLLPTARPLPDALRPRPLTLVEGLLDTRRWTRRTWFKAVGGGLAVLLVAAAGLAYSFSGGPAPPAPTSAPEPDPTPAPDAKQAPETKVEPGPQNLPQATGPGDQDLAAIDALIATGKLDEAQTEIDSLLERYPGNASLVWRDARQRSKRPGLHEGALRRYSEALKKQPELVKDPTFVGEAEALLREKPVRDTAIDLAADLGPAGSAALLAFANDPEPWATLDQRRQIREALGPVPELDLPLNRRRDLEQVAEATDPCQAMIDALGPIEAEPLVDYVPALKAATIPPPAADPGPACAQAEALLKTVRAAYVKRFPAAFAAPKKKKPIKKKKKKGR